MGRMFYISKEKSIFLKGLAILFVLLGHSGIIYNGGGWGVSLFLILSGYGIFESYKKNGLKNYFSKRIKSVYFPFILVSIVTTFVFCIFNNFNYPIKSIINSLLGLDFCNNIDHTMWFISFIFIYYIGFYLVCIVLEKIKLRKKNLFIVISMFIFGLFIYILDHYIGIWNKGAAIYLSVFLFPLGILFSFLADYKINPIIKKYLYSTLCILLLMLTLFFYNNIPGSDSVYYPFILFIYTVSLPLFLLIGFELFEIRLDNKYILYLGKYSYDIYLWEGLLLSHCDLFFDFDNNFILIGFGLTFTLLISYLYRNIVINNLLNVNKNRNS